MNVNLFKEKDFGEKSLLKKKFISSIYQIIILIENYHLLIRFLFGVSTNDLGNQIYQSKLCHQFCFSSIKLKNSFKKKIIKDLPNLFINLSKNFRRK
jgi:hypothetical protein